jgi:hypothetical protein
MESPFRRRGRVPHLAVKVIATMSSGVVVSYGMPVG